MKKNMKKIGMVFGAAVLAMSMLAGCGSKTEEAAAPKTETAGETKGTEAAGTEPAAEVSGTISMVGSTSMEKFANAISETFMQKNQNVSVSAQFVGSGAGIEAALNGTADIGNSSRNLTDEEKAAGAVENIVAIDGIAVIVDPANTVSDMSLEQLAAIYKGEITNWSELGGADAPVVVVGREAGSGTRSAFEEILEVKDSCKYSNELDSTGAVMAKIASTPGAIGYVSLDVIDDTVKTLQVGGVEANEANIKDGSYALSRPFVMATKGEISEQSAAVQALFDYIYSAEGTEVVKSVGLITVD